MPSEKKRLIVRAQTLVLGVCIVFLFVSSCKKKDRLTASTFRFSVTPPAVTLLKTSSLALTASGSTSAGTVEVNPTWTLSPAGIGTLTPDVGTSVTFQPSALGDATITATYDGLTATSQIAVVSYIPVLTTFNVYTDNGLPNDGTVKAGLFLSGLTVDEISSGYTPEGVRYLRASNSNGGHYWGVTLDAAPAAGRYKDLSSFSAGSLKFSLRLGRTVSAGEILAIRVADVSSTVSFILASGSNGYNRLSTDWQEISLPLSASFPGLDLSRVKVPFWIESQAVSSSLSFDVDAVRWDK